jgi:uncharacterized protein (UPF0332 family)
MAGALREEVEQYMAHCERTLEATQVLAEHGYWRDVLSKAYFAMFYAASALLCADGISVSKHSAVVALVGERFAKPGRIDRKLHRMLIDMLDERHVADYRIEMEITQEEAEQGLRSAREFVGAIREYLENERGG